VAGVAELVGGLVAAVSSVVTAWWALRKERQHCAERLDDFRAGLQEGRREAP